MLTEERLFLAYARLNFHDKTVIDKQIRYLHGAIEQAARVETQVKHQPLDPLFRCVFENALEIPRRVLRELSQVDVGDLVGRIEVVIPAIVLLPANAENGLDLDAAALDL